ncbi:FtsX-like permease family protein [Streptomyces sp. TX20-6-3]|uniref:ABC transporter permease n=1 Tax=Streptomyces sp. TX20-6-3 TaxID=3028705 RepID=UPI0029B86648|nr:FtsX-like permease family protein [Streptomyces sp. TX20-6-3]MDX2562250.1 FtsX-like permease family protein [Streptomyces sp. TX20-6-3]
MRSFALGAVNAARFARRLTASLIVLVLCGAIALAAGTLSAAGTQRADASMRTGSGLRQIDVQNLRDSGDTAKRLTPSSLDAIRGIPGVESVEPSLNASFTVSKNGDGFPVLLYANLARPSVLPPLKAAARDKVFPLKPGEIVLPATADGEDLTDLLGKTVTAEYTRRTSESQGTGATTRVTVVGISDPNWQLDGPSAAHAAPAQVETWAAARAGESPRRFLDTQGYTGATVVAATEGQVEQVVAKLTAEKYFAVSVRDRVAELPGILGLFQWLSKGLLALLAVVGVLAGLGIGGAVVRTRTREVGVLRTIGYTRAEVFRSFATEIGILALAAGAVAAVLGALIGGGAALGLATMEEFSAHLPGGWVSPPLWQLAATVLLSAAAILVGALRPLRRAAALDPVTVLRDW